MEQDFVFFSHRSNADPGWVKAWSGSGGADPDRSLWQLLKTAVTMTAQATQPKQPLPDLKALIAVDPDIRGGQPCLRGTRITVYDLLDYLAGGMSETEILADFPSLQPEQLRAALTFAARRSRLRR